MPHRCQVCVCLKLCEPVTTLGCSSLSCALWTSQLIHPSSSSCSSSSVSRSSAKDTVRIRERIERTARCREQFTSSINVQLSSWMETNYRCYFCSKQPQQQNNHFHSWTSWYNIDHSNVDGWMSRLNLPYYKQVEMKCIAKIKAWQKANVIALCTLGYMLYYLKAILILLSSPVTTVCIIYFKVK